MTQMRQQDFHGWCSKLLFISCEHLISDCDPIRIRIQSYVFHMSLLFYFFCYSSLWSFIDRMSEAERKLWVHYYYFVILPGIVYRLSVMECTWLIYVNVIDWLCEGDDEPFVLSSFFFGFSIVFICLYICFCLLLLFINLVKRFVSNWLFHFYTPFIRWSRD